MNLLIIFCAILIKPLLPRKHYKHRLILFCNYFYFTYSISTAMLRIFLILLLVLFLNFVCFSTSITSTSLSYTHLIHQLFSTYTCKQLIQLPTSFLPYLSELRYFVLNTHAFTRQAKVHTYPCKNRLNLLF